MVSTSDRTAPTTSSMASSVAVENTEISSKTRHSLGSRARISTDGASNVLLRREGPVPPSTSYSCGEIEQISRFKHLEPRRQFDGQRHPIDANAESGGGGVRFCQRNPGSKSALFDKEAHASDGDLCQATRVRKGKVGLRRALGRTPQRFSAGHDHFDSGNALASRRPDPGLSTCSKLSGSHDFRW